MTQVAAPAPETATDRNMKDKQPMKKNSNFKPK